MSRAIFGLFKRGMFAALTGGLVIGPNIAVAEWGLNFPEPVTPLAREIYNLHMGVTLLVTILMIIISAVVAYACYFHRKSVGHQANQTMHKSAVAKWSWLIVTVIVAVTDSFVGVPASQTLTNIETYEPGDVTLKVVGSQWKWTYEYLNDGVEDGLDDNIVFTANITSKEEAGDLYLRATDKHVVLPVNKRIRILNTARDVIHAWWVPQIGVKKDAIPGYINETWAILEKPGIYRGQCAELCGRGHAYMPIVLEAVSMDDYKLWVAKTKTEMNQTFASTGWTQTKLMEAGKKVFDTNCASCHQQSGEGIPGLFPALKGNEVATKSESLSTHIATIIEGRPGTAMPAWGPQLNDMDIASVVTYERNAWGNDTGDLIQPADIETARGSKVASSEDSDSSGSEQDE